MEKQMTNEQFKAWSQLNQPDKGFSDEEVVSLIAIAYPETDVHTFVNVFLSSVDDMDRFDSDTGHVDCPIACVQAVLAYQRVGGRILSYW